MANVYNPNVDIINANVNDELYSVRRRNRVMSQKRYSIDETQKREKHSYSEGFFHGVMLSAISVTLTVAMIVL